MDLEFKHIKIGIATIAIVGVVSYIGYNYGLPTSSTDSTQNVENNEQTEKIDITQQKNIVDTGTDYFKSLMTFFTDLNAI